MKQILYLLHILVFSILMGYIGIWKDKIAKWLYPIILIFGIIVILVHLYKLYYKVEWVNYVHILLIGPLLVYIGINKEKTPGWAFEVSLTVAFAAFGYHAYYLFRSYGQ